MATLEQVSTFFRGCSGLGAAEMRLCLHRARKAGLPLTGGNKSAVTVDDAVWLLLAILAGSVQRVRQVAWLPNSRQALNGITINDGNPAMSVFDGLRDAINLRRAEAIASAADFRLVERAGFFSAKIGCQSILQQSLPGLPAGSPVSWTFTFGRPVELADPDPGFWRVSAVDAEVINSLANLFGPLKIASDEPLGMYPLPDDVPAHYQAPTVH